MKLTKRKTNVSWKEKTKSYFFRNVLFFDPKVGAVPGNCDCRPKTNFRVTKNSFIRKFVTTKLLFRLRSYFGQLTKMLWLNQKYIIDTGSSGFEHLTFQSFSIYKVMEPWLRHSGAVVRMCVSIMIKGRNDYLPNKYV